jgi:phage gpG-like protein
MANPAAFISVNDSGVVELMREVSGRLDELGPVAEAWSLIMLRSAQQTFLAGGRPAIWPDLQPSTIARRRKEGKDYQILRDSGLLMLSLHPVSTNEYSVREEGNGFAYVGTTRPGAQNHQEGITLPQRIFLVHQPQDIEDYKTVLRDYVLTADASVPTGG